MAGMDKNVVLAFALTAFAELAAGIGSALAFFSKRTNKYFLSAALGFSAGVMIYVSFVEILTKARDSLAASQGEVKGTWFAVLSFFCGMLVIMLIDLLIPSPHNLHDLYC